MDTILRTGAPLSALQLYGLKRDGLVVQLTDTAWAAAGVSLSPQLRAAALGPTPLASCAYSHAAAHWIWWGAGQAPALIDVTTLKRRRVRRAPDGVAVWERTLKDADCRDMGPCTVTGPLKTLFDVIVDCVMPIGDEQTRRRAALTALAPAEPRQRRALADLVDDSFRRPGVVEIRQLLRDVDPAARTR